MLALCSLLTLLASPLALAAPAGSGQVTEAPSAAPTTTTETTTTAVSSESEETVQALVCSLVVGQLPDLTFRRESRGAWAVCRCVSPIRALCQPATPYPTVAPGSPDAVLAQELAPSGPPQYLETLYAFSLQQTCFLHQLVGRTCAFSWEAGHSPACDCAQKLDFTQQQQEEGTTQEQAGATQEQAGATQEQAGVTQGQEAGKQTGTTAAPAEEATGQQEGQASSDPVAAAQESPAEQQHLRSGV